MPRRTPKRARGARPIDDDAALAFALVRLSREPAEVERRTAAARAHGTSRSWDDAAREYLAHPSGAVRDSSTCSPFT